MQIYVLLGTEQKGPLTVDELNEMLSNGAVNQKTLIWFEGLIEWSPIEKFSEIFKISQVDLSPPSEMANNVPAFAPSRQVPSLNDNRFVRSSNRSFFEQLIPFLLDKSENGKLWETVGRIGRRQYFSRILAIEIALFILNVIILTLIIMFSPDTLKSFDSFLFGSYILISSFVGLPHCIKRLHDIGLGGEYALISFIPILSLILFIVMCSWPGSSKHNKYG
jgi:uncharacterized membrane protein YhaH (DUF805 family)